MGIWDSLGLFRRAGKGEQRQGANSRRGRRSALKARDLRIEQFEQRVLLSISAGADDDNVIAWAPAQFDAATLPEVEFANIPFDEDQGYWLDFDASDGNLPGEAAGIQVTGMSDSAFSGRVELPGAWLDPVTIQGSEFVGLTLPGNGYSEEIGTPRVPVIREILTAPVGAEVGVSVSGSAATFSIVDVGPGLPLVPVQPPVVKVPGALESAPLVIDDAAYQTDGLSVETGIRVLEAGTYAGQRLVMVEVMPVTYNPASGSVFAYDTLDFTVSFTGGAKSGSLTAREEQHLADLTHNYQIDAQTAQKAKQGGNLLIIVHDDFVGAIDAFVTHKESLGWTVQVADTSTAGTTTAAIQNYVKTQYNNVSTRPDALLLIGDVDRIPNWVGQGLDSPDTDLYYATMDAGDDWIPEFPVGRFSVADAQQLADVIDKTIAYETSSLDDWTSHAAFMAGIDNYTITEGTHDWVISSHMDPLGFTSDRLYMVSSGATTQDVVDAFNAGRVMGVYSGHGAEDGWYDGPPMSQSDVTSLTNSGMYPFVASFACLTGRYSVNESFMETWLRAPDKGAVAAWGSSVTSYWDEDDILEKELFNAIFTGGNFEIGLATVRAKEEYLNYWGSGGTTRRYFEMYNVMGDPTVKLLTEGEPVEQISPDLVAVIPNEGQVLTVDMEGHVFHVAPRELLLRFNEGQQIDPATLDGVRLIRSVDGQFGNRDPVTQQVLDEEVEFGWIGLGDWDNEVIVRFAENLPDDLYRLVVVGSDTYVDLDGQPVAPLANTLGVTFRSDYPAGQRDLEFDFELNLGPQVVAVVPQPIVRGPVMTVQNLPDDGEVFGVDGGDGLVLFEFEDTFIGDGQENGGILVEFDSTVDGPSDVAAAIEAAIQDQITGGALPNVTGVNVQGAVVTIEGPRATVQYGGAAMQVQHLRQLRKVLEVYFNDDDLLDTPDSAENPNFYQLFVTGNSADPSDDTMVLPVAVDYDPATDKAVLTFGDDLASYGTGAFRLRIGNEYQPVQTEFQVAPADAGTSLATAMDVRTDIGGSLAPIFGDGSGPQSLIIGGSVDPHALDFTLEWPGAIDEPGHRDLPNYPSLAIEDHFGGESAPDRGAGVPSVSYYFPNASWNLITAAQKDRAREIFALYGQYLGIQFYEADSGIAVVTGDLALLGLQSGPGGVAGLGGGGVALMDYAEDWGSSLFGGGWFQVAMHEIGHCLGYGHTYDLPPLTIMGSGEDLDNPVSSSEPTFPGDNDILHGQHMYRPDSIDIDMYRFDLDQAGLFSAEILAERMDDSSLLDAVVTLYDADGQVVARNDDYYSEDSALEIYLQQGTYYIGVTASGNTQYDPDIEDTGVGGVTQGDYELRLSFDPRAVNPNDPATFLVDVNNPASITHMVDDTGVLFDGDYDGVPGGVYNFWFNVQLSQDNLFVDKIAPDGGDGSLAAPYNTVSDAFDNAGSGDIVRIVGNNFDDDDPATPATLRDNVPYEIGYNLFEQALSDGTRMEVPKGVTVMIDAGAVFKLRKANIDVGSSAEGVDRSGGALQVLGTPEHSVYFTSHYDETIGEDTAPLMVTTPEEGNWGGLVFRNNLDYDFIASYDPASTPDAREVLETQGIFLNYVNHADIRFGGGEVVVNGVRGVYTPVHMVEARPTVTFNTITNSADAALSGDPNSFADTKFENWDHTQPFTAGYQRVGPQVYGNLLKAVYAVSVNPSNPGSVAQEHINSTNGMFVRIRTLAGRPVEELEVPGRFDDWDIVHVISENLFVNGTPAGPIVSPTTTQLVRTDAYHLRAPDGDGIEDGETFAIFDGSTRVVFEFNLGTDFTARGSGSFIAGHVEIRYNRSDDPDPGDPAFTADQMASNNVYSTGGIVEAINWARDNLGLDVTAVNQGGGAIELRTTAPVWELEGFGTLDPRIDARLRIDPGLIVKLEGSRIEAEFGAQVIAEGRPAADVSAPGYPVIFTSLADTRYGTGGTFDTSEDTSSRVPQPGDWGGLVFAPTATGSIDEAVVAYAGGITPIEGDFARFAAVEVRQAQARVTNTRFEFNDAGFAGDRSGRGTLQPATIFVRGAQPIIVGNTFLGNDGAVVSVDANSFKAWVVPDWGRTTGPISDFEEYADNYGPMVRGRDEHANRLGVVDNPLLTNEINGMEVRPATLTTESIWDDTDIVHVLRGEIIVPEFHHVGGLRLQSSSEGSLVVKLSGDDAGFTAQGRPLEIDDRIGGTVQIVGVPGKPVVLTDLADDTVGAGFGLRGQPQLDTNGDGDTLGSPGAWRSIRLERYSNDRNVAIVNEWEAGSEVTVDLNATPLISQPLGELSPYEKAGDDNLRLGFEVHGFIRTDDPTDVDVYQFDAEAGTEIWIDIDRTTFALDTIIELIDANGTVVASSDNSHQANSYSTKDDPDADLIGLGMDRDTWIRTDFYTTNPRDAGMRLVLPGPAGEVRTYYVRVKGDGNTAGKYQMQIRLREMQEIPGCTVQYADIRYATNGIEVLGYPQHSPLLGETAESTSNNNSMAGAQYLGNLLTTDRNAISLAGYLTGRTDVDWYQIDVDYEAIQSIAGINDAGSIISTIFDIDYADGMARPDLAMWVFDRQGRLILMSEESNVADDRPPATGSTSLDDLDRGSIWPRDPFIGPAYLPEGPAATYYVAITSTLATPQVLSSVLGGTWSDDPLANPLVRVEPIDSIARVVEEHVDTGPNSFIEAVNPNVDSTPSADPGGTQRLSLVPDEFQLGDVIFYSITGTDLFTVDPFTGARETDVTNWSDPYLPGSPNIRYHDIAMRNDGRLMTVTRGSGANFNPRYREFDTGNANTLLLDTDTGIDVIRRDPANPTALQADPGNSVYVEAMVHRSYNTGNGGRDVFVVGNIPNPDLGTGQIGVTSGHNLMWLLDPNGNAVNHPLINRGIRASGNRLFSNIVPTGQLFSAPTILANQASQTDPIYQFPGGVQPLDYRDGDWFTVTDAAATSLEFEFDLGIDVRIDPQGAAAFRDGQWFRLVNDVNGWSYDFEFNSGPVIVLPATATAALDGVTVTVPGTAPGGGNVSLTFEFDSDNTMNNPANVRVGFANNTSGNVVAATLVTAINGRTEFTVVASNVGSRVSLVNDRTDTLPVSSNPIVGIDGDHVFVGGRQPVPFEESWAATQFGQSIENVVDASQAGIFPATSRIDASYAFRSTTTANPVSPGDRITFLNARTTSTFANTGGNMTYVEGSPGAPGRVRVPFGAGYTGAEMAQTIANAISGAAFGVTASLVGATVELSGADPLNPVTLNNAPQLEFTGEGVGGDITGLAYIDVPGIGNRLFAVSDEGGLYYITQESAWRLGGSWGFTPVDPQGAFNYFRRVPTGGPQLHFIGQVLNPSNGQPVRFSGLAAGPKNVEDARFAQTLFASDTQGNVWALDIDGNLLGTFADGRTSVNPSGVGTIYGVDFSPIDYNLWHWTRRRWNDEGHGIYQTFDDTRVSSEYYNPKREGNTSYYFGLDDPNDGDSNQSQPGAGNFDPTQNSDGSRQFTYDLPGGAHGSLTTGTFSLKGYTASDRPTLYFTYYAETQNSADFDGVRVFVSGDGADWRLMATNTDLNDNSLIRPRIDQPGAAGTYIRDVHDIGGNWRQARLDLSEFAGMDSVRVRFDFSTASDMDIGNLVTAGEYLTAPAAAELHDGATFAVDGVNFEFDMGYALVLPNVAGVQIKDDSVLGGEYFDVSDGSTTIRFEFEKTGWVQGVNTPIAISDAMTARQVADLIASVVNASALNVRALVPTDDHFQGANGNRVFLIGATSVTQGTYFPAAPLAITIEGSAPGQYTGGRTPVYVRPDVDQFEVSRLVANAVNRRFRSVADRIYIPPSMTAGTLNGTAFTITGLNNVSMPAQVRFEFSTASAAASVLDPNTGPLDQPRVRVGVQGANTPALIASRIAAAINLMNTTTGWQVSATSTPDGFVQLAGPQTAFNGLNPLDPANSPLRAYDVNETTIKLDEGEDDTRGQVQPLMHVYIHPVTDAGPLSHKNFLEGDTTSKYYGPTARSNNRFYDYRRGQNNSYEGWYVDDVIIGFAERGEMVTNAPADVNLFDFAAGPQVTDPVVVEGAYQLEVRRGDEYGVLLTPPDSPYRIVRLFSQADTQDRWAQAFTIDTPAASDIAHGDRFWLDDGVNRQEFIFHDSVIRGSTGNAIAIYFDAAMSDGRIANLTAAAINQAYAQGLLDVTAASLATSSRVDMWGVTAVLEKRFRLLPGSGSGIDHRDAFRIEDSSGNAVDFIFLYDVSGELPPANWYAIYFNFGMTAQTIATRVAAQINQARVDGRLTVTATPNVLVGMVDLSAEATAVEGIDYTRRELLPCRRGR